METDNKSLIKPAAPQVDALIEQAERSYEVADEKTKALIKKLFLNLQDIAICGEDERCELWLTAPRGLIDDFGDYHDYLEAQEVENYSEFEELWRIYYPEPTKWYHLITCVYKEYYSVFINGKLVLQIHPEPQRQYAIEKSDLVEWLLSSVNEAIRLLKAGLYNEFVSQNLPYRKRLGKIHRNDLWCIFPDAKSDYLEDISPADIERFVDLMKSRPDDKPANRLKEMTASVFFDSCRQGYAANKYEGFETLPPKALYLAHADGRDEGLTDLDEESSEAFNEWYHDRKRIGGHPWEVCRGGNSTHISLYVICDDQGWWFCLAGSSMGRSIETIKFYLALIDKGLPVELRDGPEIAAMLTGSDDIGIVSEDIFPRYCSLLFPGDNLLTYMNLPYEKAEQVIEATAWFPIEEVKLASE